MSVCGVCKGLRFVDPSNDFISEGGKLCEFKHRRLLTLKEVHMKNTRVMAAAVLIVGSGLYVARAQEAPKPTPPAPTIAGVMAGTKRIGLQRHDLGVPGREVIQVRVELAPGAVAPKHSHPGEEIIYVLEGTFEYEVEGKPPVTLTAGGVLFIPAGTNHSAKNVGSGTAAELATYIIEKGKPLVVLAK
jgi:quercetin dioxygenase-like cupin family protein